MSDAVLRPLRSEHAAGSHMQKLLGLCRVRGLTDVSLRRYAKEAKLIGEFLKVDPAVIEYGTKVLADLAGVISGQRPLPPPFL